ncbi:hypothetical protein ES707_02982 [subsurface metagenome]
MDIETLRPSAPGTKTEWDIQYPYSGAHWEKVDEVDPDELDTYLSLDLGSGTVIDLFNIPDHSGSGIINSVTLYLRGKTDYATGFVLRPIIFTNGVEYAIFKSVYEDWLTISNTWDVNPQTGLPWTWAEIDALEIGVKAARSATYHLWCTQVYVEVDYTPAKGGSRGYIIG